MVQCINSTGWTLFQVWIALRTQVDHCPCIHPLSTASCRYSYSVQPPRDLLCNPYLSNTLRLSCSVSYDSSEETLSLSWIHIPESDPEGTPILLTEGEKYSILLTTFTSQLQIKNFGEMDAGRYSCQLVFENGSRTERSQELNLYQRLVFNNFDFSTTTCPQVQFTSETSCALMGEIGSGVDIGLSTPIATNDPSNNDGGNPPVIPGGRIEAWIIVVAVVLFIVIMLVMLVVCCVLCRVCEWWPWWQEEIYYTCILLNILYTTHSWLKWSWTIVMWLYYYYK